LALCAAGAGFTLLLSSYALASVLGLILAAASLAGPATFLFLPLYRPVVGAGQCLLSCLLLVGRFYGNLTNVNAVLLFTAPLLLWTVEIHALRRLGPRRRMAVGLALVNAPIAVALASALRQFLADANTVGSGRDW
jgi:hypothetical protein